jgi:hypothetical protein
MTLDTVAATFICLIDADLCKCVENSSPPTAEAPRTHTRAGGWPEPAASEGAAAT